MYVTDLYVTVSDWFHWFGSRSVGQFNVFDEQIITRQLVCDSTIFLKSIRSICEVCFQKHQVKH